jgi:hypothetical protein
MWMLCKDAESMDSRFAYGMIYFNDQQKKKKQPPCRVPNAPSNKLENSNRNLKYQLTKC